MAYDGGLSRKESMATQTHLVSSCLPSYLYDNEALCFAFYFLPLPPLFEETGTQNKRFVTVKPHQWGMSTEACFLCLIA
jgi:hypothetical protein